MLHKDKLNEVSSERLDVLCQTQDGFKIAEKDLEIRGPGEIMGAQQTGIVPFKYANLIRDSRYLEETKLIAEKIFNEDRQLANKLIRDGFLDQWPMLMHKNPAKAGILNFLGFL